LASHWNLKPRWGAIESDEQSGRVEDLDSILTPCPDISVKAVYGNTPVKAKKQGLIDLSV
jgi:hypothetical protein